MQTNSRGQLLGADSLLFPAGAVRTPAQEAMMIPQSHNIQHQEFLKYCTSHLSLRWARGENALQPGRRNATTTHGFAFHRSPPFTLAFVLTFVRTADASVAAMPASGSLSCPRSPFAPGLHEPCEEAQAARSAARTTKWTETEHAPDEAQARER